MFKGIIRNYEDGDKFGDFFTSAIDGRIIVMVEGCYWNSFKDEAAFDSWLKSLDMFIDR